MTITIEIPAMQALANAILYHADAQRPLSTREALAALTADALGANDPEPQVGDPSQPATAANPVMTKRTRRTKAEMLEAQKIEDLKGRRVDAHGEEVKQGVTSIASQENPVPDAENAGVTTGFQWTFELLKQTFVDPIKANDDSEEEKGRVKALRDELVEIRKAVDPVAQNLMVMKPEAYGEFAAKATVWYREKGMPLKLPEGAE